MNIPKYRVWHKRRKQMMPVLEIDLDPEDGGVFVESADGNYCGCRLGMKLWMWADIELMQFTGAKDDSKEKKEIYDGDIIQTTTMYSDKDIARVCWGEVHPMDRWMTGPTWLLHFENGTEGPLYPYCDYRNGYTVKVIGNIYEHPERFTSEKPA